MVHNAASTNQEQLIGIKLLCPTTRAQKKNDV